MADPMWSGGAEQFQDRYPWIWFVMSDWAKAPFYPTDPAKDPSAFVVQAGVVLGMPILGTIYAPYVTEYCTYYIAQWDANPPGSSSSTPALPTLPTVPDPAYNQAQDWLGRFNAMWADVIYAGNEAHAAHLAADLILERLPQGEDPPPIATSNDTARILAGIYYTNWLWYNNPPPVSVPDVLDAIADAHAVTDGKIDAHDLSMDGFATNVQNAFQAQTELIDNVSGDIDDLAAAVAEIPTEAGDPRYPGPSNVTWGEPQTFSGSHTYSASGIGPGGVMDGLRLTINSVPAGSYQQGAEGITVHKYQGWLNFIDGDGNCDDLQWLGANKRIYAPVSMRSPSAVVIYAKTGTSITVTAYAL